VNQALVRRQVDGRLDIGRHEARLANPRRHTPFATRSRHAALC
jgi:hypothetical protein